jgi:uridylate kinase
MCIENHIDLLVFNMNKKGNIKRAVLGEKIGTVVKWEEKK